jgi:hypothetical protein
VRAEGTCGVGATVDAALANAIRRLDDATWLDACAQAMHLTAATARRALDALHVTLPQAGLNTNG